MWGHLEGRGNVTIILANRSFNKANWSTSVSHSWTCSSFSFSRPHQLVMRVQECVICQQGGSRTERTSYLCGSRDTNSTSSFNSSTLSWRQPKERQPPLVLITLFGNFSPAPTWLLSISADSFLHTSSLQAGSRRLLLMNTQVRDLSSKIGGGLIKHRLKRQRAKAHR